MKEILIVAKWKRRKGNWSSQSDDGDKHKTILRHIDSTFPLQKSSRLHADLITILKSILSIVQSEFAWCHLRSTRHVPCSPNTMNKYFLSSTLAGIFQKAISILLSLEHMRCFRQRMKLYRDDCVDRDPKHHERKATKIGSVVGDEGLLYASSWQCSNVCDMQAVASITKTGSAYSNSWRGGIWTCKVVGIASNLVRNSFPARQDQANAPAYDECAHCFITFMYRPYKHVLTERGRIFFRGTEDRVT